VQKSFFDEKQEPARIKHLILEKYLHAWAKVIRSKFPAGFYVDAFAGQGEYESGEEGSPIIAARILGEKEQPNCLFQVICVEKNRQHFTRLQNAISQRESRVPVTPYLGEFDDYADRILAEIGDTPAFFFIDPSGFKGVEMRTVRNILERPHKEVFINFMYNAVQRWKSSPSPGLGKTLDAFFGGREWQRIQGELDLLKLYLRKLRHGGAYAYYFRNKFPDKDRTFYYLIYATKVFVAFKIMKDVMVKREMKERFQMNLFEDLEFGEYRRRVYSKIASQVTVPRDDLVRFTYLETDSYVNRDLTKALKRLENEGKIVKVSTGNEPAYAARSDPEAPSPRGVYRAVRAVEPTVPVWDESQRVVRQPGIKISQFESLDGSVKKMVARVGDGSIITRFDKTPVPSKPTDVVCPHFLELKWAYGCPYDCAWCYLKGTFRFLPTRARPKFKDRQKVEQHVLAFLNTPTQPEVLNTGEIADSLMQENTSGSFVEFIAPLFESQNRHKVLFVTKSDKIEHLLQQPTHDQVIVSFSLNAEKVAERWEKLAPVVPQRIEAARRLTEAGFTVRIRIDPIIPVPRWKQMYTKLLEDIFSSFRPERITLGSLRGLQSTINGCSDKSWTQYLSERSNWGKKIAFGTRLQMYETVSEALRRKHNYARIALCKETVRMWDALGMDYTKIKCNCVW